MKLNTIPLSTDGQPDGKRPYIVWTPEVVETALSARRRGMTGGQIAEIIRVRHGKTFSASAVIGFFNRLKKNPKIKPKRTTPPAPALEKAEPPPPGHPLHRLPLIVRRSK